VRGKEYSELAGRLEVNLMDLFFSLLENNITQENISSYLKESKIKHLFSKQPYIGRIYATEEKERNALIKKINANNVTASSAIKENILNAIPRPLRLFPRDFALKETESKFEITEDAKKSRNAIKTMERKSIEDIISSNNYYDLSKKHTRRRNSIDVNNLFSEIIKTENINLGKKFKPTQSIDKELQNLKKDEIFLSGIHINETVLDKNLIGGNLGESDLIDKSNYNMLEDSNI
jgi:hypothetical protein